MATYRKRPITIEAVPVVDLLGDAAHAWSNLPPWALAAYDRGDLTVMAHEAHVRTLEGIMVARREDWLIRGVQGEIYPCKPDIFAATYEAVDDE